MYLICPPHSEAILISGWEHLAMSHHPDKFGNYRHDDSVDISLICHITSRDHVFNSVV